jgi:hypothetical protein
MWLALAASLLALASAAALTVVGVRTLADSKAGSLADENLDPRPVQRLPYTPTALLGTVDDLGRLTSVVVMAIEPDGTGGSIVELAASADANSGNTGELAPFNAVLTGRGPEAWRSAVEALTGVAFDVVELADQRRFAQLIAPLGDIPVTLPVTVYDASSEEHWDAGDGILPGPVAARVVTAVDPTIDDWLYEPARAAIWSGVAERVGAGIGTASPVASDVDLPRPANLDAFAARLFAARVQFRSLSLTPIDDDRVAEEMPLDLGVAFGVAAKDAVSVHDRSELLMVMGAVAPGRVGAPLEAPSFRVVMGFTDADLEPLGVRGSDVLKQAIIRLLFARVNVVSVAELPGSAVPEHTTFVVADQGVIDGVRDTYTEVFGNAIDVQVADVLIDGVDIQLVLGRDFLDEVERSLAAESTGGVAGSVADDRPDASSDTTPADAGGG